MARLLRLVPWLGRRRAEQDIRRELELHLALETRQNLERGMPPGEATRAARVALGNTALIAEEARAVWGWAWRDALARDVRLALRLTGGAPGFWALCVLVPAFGIGMSTTLYAVISGTSTIRHTTPTTMVSASAPRATSAFTVFTGPPRTASRRPHSRPVRQIRPGP